MVSLAFLKHEMIDNEIPSKKIRVFWLSLLVQNTIFFVFYSFWLDKLNEFTSSSLFVFEAVLALLNVFSFLVRIKYQKGLIKTIDSEIQEDLLTENEKNETKTRENSFLEKNEENTISSAEIVNKFMRIYEQEEEMKKSKEILAKASFSSDEESEVVNSRSEVEVLIFINIK